ncbi:hypothetical protein O1611_g1109 [Lasiodiplodia mahajangana]|uniref:Uncharacterized protein n=1 Tax=Lasiodiplodia mahajangana TaxID=1108764 RepID=A0ACC2JYH9_9PEZI|nr:hypothetical protein O1611_g1109 [Lasiodiplodia mahajangana]
MEDEVKRAIMHAMPDGESKWTKIKPYHEILEVAASMSARIFVGLPLCRDRGWLEASVQFTENGQVQKLFIPEIERRRALLSEGKLDEAASRTALSWMIQYAEAADEDSCRLAHLALIIVFVSIHTTMTHAVHALYDLAARPKYIEDLREEIREVAAAGHGCWDKASYTQLRKMDSFMKESQRHNPSDELSMSRFMERSYDMSDGTHLPRGTMIAMPTRAIQNDPAITENPDVFDGLRYYQLRQEPNMANRYQFVSTGETQLHFGYGRAACPGRFLADLEVKMILVHLIMNYDFKLVGEHRPGNLRLYEFIVPNPEGELLVRQRAKPESPL